MPRVRTLTEEERRILRENHLDPEHYGVTRRTDTSITLFPYDTRDDMTLNTTTGEIEIRKGDRPW